MSSESWINSDLQIDFEKAFPPLKKYCPHPPSRHQALFLLLDCREAFYGGAAGGGKSDALLMGALQFVDQPDYSALILRRTFMELSKSDSLIPRSHEWLARTDAKWSERDKTWLFPSGARLEFGHVENENDKHNYQSAAYQYVAFDELTSFSESQYDYIGFSRTRRRMGSRIPIRTRSASNPGNVGHGWVKKRFVDSRKPGTVFIPAKVKDNPGLDVAEYRASLSDLPDVLREQLLAGDWGAFEGQAFQEFDSSLHCIPPIQPEDNWERFESMDYGISNPTAWIFWAVDFDGNLIALDSHYAPGLPSETAPVIKAKRAVWKSSQCFGDPASLAQRTSTVNKWGQPATIETEFADLGIPLIRANNDPRAGYTRLREGIKPDPKHVFPDWHPWRGKTGSPRVFIVAKGCPQLVEQFETAPLQPADKQWTGEMVDPAWEGPHGHALAAARYGVMSRPLPSVEEVKPPENPDWDPVQQARSDYLWQKERDWQQKQSSQTEQTWEFV